MKRFQTEVAGLSSPSGTLRDVAGVTTCRPVPEIASGLVALSNSFDVAGGPVATAEEFVEFLLGRATDGIDLPDADAFFREALKRRLWRMHVMRLPRDRHTTH
ncbi:MAG: hypothetical protein JRG86_06040 [Deltaproteobacteria bacterium]|nr:hypothetical protein [Deltaproteobacteria bacterium]MBW2498411.1 hypothetical protein [Deltaproteobacteria bacterium]